MTEPTEVNPAPTRDQWTLYGPVYDRKATIGVITALQAKGLHVRVVRVDNRNDIYTQDAS